MTDHETERTEIVFTVPGPPRSWKRANVSRGRLLEPARQRALKQAVAAHFRRAAAVLRRSTGLGWPSHAARYALRVDAYQRRSVSSVPDVDNLAKLVADALNGVAYVDDARIVRMTVEKHDVREVGGEPRTEVRLEVVA